jgi:hypothetical protein
MNDKAPISLKCVNCKGFVFFALDLMDDNPTKDSMPYRCVGCRAVCEVGYKGDNALIVQLKQATATVQKWVDDFKDHALLPESAESPSKEINQGCRDLHHSLLNFKSALYYARLDQLEVKPSHDGN